MTTAISDMQAGYHLHVESDLKGAYVSSKQITSTISGDGTWVLATYYGPSSPHRIEQRSSI